MSNEARYFRVGIFVLGGALLLVLGLVLFGASRIFQPRINVETYVNGSVQGIDIGSPVKFRGVTIGKISQVGFTSIQYPEQVKGNIYNYVLVVMELTKPVFPGMFGGRFKEAADQAVEDGLRARIEPQGITGMSYMEIDYVNPDNYPPLPLNWTPDFFYIPSAPGQLASILDSINKIMADIEHLNLAGIGSETVKLLGNMNTAIEGAELGKLSADARKLFQELDRTVAASDFPAMSAEARAAMAEVTKATAEAKTILANLEPATRLNSDDLNASLANLRIISDNLRVITSDAKRYPSRLFFGGPPEHSEVMPAPGPTPKERKRDPR